MKSQFQRWGGEKECEEAGSCCKAVLPSTPTPRAEEEPWWEMGGGVSAVTSRLAGGSLTRVFIELASPWCPGA